MKNNWYYIEQSLTWVNLSLVESVNKIGGYWSLHTVSGMSIKVDAQDYRAIVNVIRQQEKD